MRTDSGGLRRWTERFTVASTACLLLSLLLIPTTGGTRLSILVALLGFVCPMIFGMAYLLLPPYVGRTLANHRLPGIHFVLAYVGVALLVTGWGPNGLGALFALGAVAWSLGIAVFVGALVATVVPAILADPSTALRRGDRPQRSTRLATAILPVAIGHLVLGTGILLWVGVVGAGRWTIAQALHLYGAGFGALLIFALSARLLIGFYHVSPPRYILRGVLIAGATAPGLLALTMWIEPWFTLGAMLEMGAMVGYGIVVLVVALRTDRRRFGLFGIFLGSVGGLAAVIAAAPLAIAIMTIGGSVAVHRTLVLWGFFPLTIVGYAVLFFPVTNGQFFGASHRVVTTTMALLAGGVLLRSIGIGAGVEWIQFGGIVVSVFGALSYCYLIGRRFYG